ncbi:MAG: biopolymer transporter ExbD [Pseudomonadota bacterium]
MFDFRSTRPARRPNLTPLVDVVFLLLIFFVVFSRFGVEQALPVQLAGGAGNYEGPPRLIEVAPDGLRLNGISLEPDMLPGALAPLTAGPSDLIVVVPQQGVPLRGLVDVVDALHDAGHANVAVLEAE